MVLVPKPSLSPHVLETDTNHHHSSTHSLVHQPEKQQQQQPNKRTRLSSPPHTDHYQSIQPQESDQVSSIAHYRLSFSSRIIAE